MLAAMNWLSKAGGDDEIEVVAVGHRGAVGETRVESVRSPVVRRVCRRPWKIVDLMSLCRSLSMLPKQMMLLQQNLSWIVYAYNNT